MTKYTFNDFITNIDEEHVNFYNELHSLLTDNMFTTKVELKKTGYALSYLHKTSKKTLLNFVNRKKGTFIRIYGDHSDKYMECFKELPDDMVKELKKAGPCKRVLDSEACNSRCKMGINLEIEERIYNKCRFSAMFFLVSTDKYNYILKFIESEVEARFDDMA